MSEQMRQPERRQGDDFRIDIYEDGHNHFWVDRADVPFDIEGCEERYLQMWENSFEPGTVFLHLDSRYNTKWAWRRKFFAFRDGVILEEIEVCQIDDSEETHPYPDPDDEL